MIVMFHKPYGVLCQFTGDSPNLSAFIEIPGVYAAGRLDKDSEGLLILTDDGRVQDQLAHPRHGKQKTYWVQVEGAISDDALDQLRGGLVLKDGPARALTAERLADAPLPPRDPPIRVRQSIPTSWLSITLNEGRNRQVRRMTASVGFPTLRLIRTRVGPFSLDDLPVGAYRVDTAFQLHSTHDPRNTPPRHRRNVRRR
ncbi:MAG: pseudouridine synthase [Litorivicinaceae bacterium]